MPVGDHQLRVVSRCQAATGIGSADMRAERTIEMVDAESLPQERYARDGGGLDLTGCGDGRCLVGNCLHVDIFSGMFAALDGLICAAIK
jgi:hypothetical protein